MLRQGPLLVVGGGAGQRVYCPVMVGEGWGRDNFDFVRLDGVGRRECTL